jgi:hypothetical protein
MSGGYRPKRTLYKLNFAETEHAGLEVLARATSVDGLLGFIDLGAELDGLDARLRAATEAGDPAELAELKKKIRGVFAPFARVLQSWNVEDDDGAPVPATLDGLLSQELPFVGQIIEAYVGAMATAPPPLQSSSPSGATSPGAPPPGLASASKSLRN